MKFSYDLKVLLINKLLLTKVVLVSPRHWSSGLVSSGASFTSWWEGTSLALVSHPSRDVATMKLPYGIDDLLHRPASILSFLILLGWLKLDLNC